MDQLVLLLAGVMYAGVFLVVCSKRPKIALMLIIATSPLQYDISGGGPAKFSLAEIHLLLSVPLVLLRGKRLHWGPTFVPAMLYLAVGVAFTSFQWRGSSTTSIIQIAIYYVIVVMVFATLAKEVEDYRFAIHGLFAMDIFLAICICILRTPYLFGIHKNGIGGSLATAFVVAFGMWLCETHKKRRLFYLVTSAILASGTIITLSRGAWVGAALGTLVILGLRREFKLMLRTTLAAIPIIVIGWLSLPAQSREYATSFGAENDNIKARYDNIDIAMKAYASNPIFGVGIGFRKEYDATNLFMTTLAETGPLGVVAVGAVHLAVAILVWRTHRILLPRSLGFAIVAAAGGLVLGKLAHGMVDHYWGRGSLTVAWASVGMATRFAYEQRKQRRQDLRFAGNVRLAGRHDSPPMPASLPST